MQVWKESDGVHTGHPGKVSTSQLVAYVTPEEAAELTSFGNEVLHPFTMQCAMETNVPIAILNTFKPDGAGTVVNALPEDKIKQLVATRKGKSGVVAVCSKKNVPVLNVTGNGVLEPSELFAQIFNTFARHGVKSDLVTSSIAQISVTLHETTTQAQIAEVVKELEEFAVPRVRSGRAIVSCVGEGMAHQVGVAAQVFQTLADAGISIEMLAQGASEINIACVIDQKDEDKAVKAIHKKFLEN